MSDDHLDEALPGAELVKEGLHDLEHNRITDCSLLVLIAAPRLKSLGIEVPERPSATPHEHALYERLEQRLGAGAHSYYNSLIRRIVSYEQSLEREKSLRESNVPNVSPAKSRL